METKKSKRTNFEKSKFIHFTSFMSVVVAILLADCEDRGNDLNWGLNDHVDLLCLATTLNLTVQ
jgi:hypothetical protein